MSNIFKSIHKAFETKVQKIARKCGKAPEDLPMILQDEHTAKVVLHAMKACQFQDDPGLIIQWNERGFNDVPNAPGFRNGVPGQTKQALINHFVNNGATNVYDLNLVFMFENPDKLADCEIIIPVWARHQPGIPDVCSAICRIDKITDTTYSTERFLHAFNR
ncbi:hypothetical protein Glove_499g46 [Diversispora epigaea]|uniref:Uncharacterized protein n=1 Tax=Diversispora epigaea TaxID=1348612 RepID=A0A397GQX1_9GLOM|nr:hypothetical protein Glove_499g46 [Diversispora epigaea]